MSLYHSGVLDIVFIELGEVFSMTGDQRGDGEYNILAGHGEILYPFLRMLDAGLTYIAADLCTDQGWIRRRFGINRCSLVKFLGEN